MCLRVRVRADGRGERDVWYRFRGQVVYRLANMESNSRKQKKKCNLEHFVSQPSQILWTVALYYCG